MHNNFADAIKVATKGVLHEHVARGRGLSAAEVKALDGARYKDVCSRLREDHFDSCLALNGNVIDASSYVRHCAYVPREDNLWATMTADDPIATKKLLQFQKTARPR